MLAIKNLEKKFKNTTAVDNVSFEAPSGEITGLIGKNGAGKTTTFHSILNLIQYEGEILWNGGAIDNSTKNEIGYLPEERSLISNLTVEQQILYLANLKNMTTKDAKANIDRWLEELLVTGKKTDKVKSLSKGNQQKVQLICTLIHQPKLIILDEPFSGLDPVNTEILKNVIFRLRNDGATIIFSSHDMSNVESMCNKVIMLKQGKNVLNGTISEIKNMFEKNRIYIRSNWTKQELEQLSDVESVKKLDQEDRFLLNITNSSAGTKIFDQVTSGHYIPEFNQVQPSLDEIFKLKMEDVDDE